MSNNGGPLVSYNPMAAMMNNTIYNNPQDDKFTKVSENIEVTHHNDKSFSIWKVLSYGVEQYSILKESKECDLRSVIMKCKVWHCNEWVPIHHLVCYEDCLHNVFYWKVTDDLYVSVSYNEFNVINMCKYITKRIELLNEYKSKQILLLSKGLQDGKEYIITNNNEHPVTNNLSTTDEPRALCLDRDNTFLTYLITNKKKYVFKGTKHLREDSKCVYDVTKFLMTEV